MNTWLMSMVLFGLPVQGDLNRSNELFNQRLMSCTSCHGVNGKSTLNTTPHLAGQRHSYLVKQLKDFKSKVRKDPTMNAMAAELDDDSIEEFAKYFSSLEYK